MKERPILFKPEMVRAILAGQKTQTRRPLKDKYQAARNHRMTMDAGVWAADLDPMSFYFSCPYGMPGDRLWVRETHFVATGSVDGGPSLVHYRADGEAAIAEVAKRCGLWRPSIFMPRWASRITLEVVSVRVERLRDITEQDAIAEGIDQFEDGCGWTVTSWQRHAEEAYRELWDSINGAGEWRKNPWVWVVEFKRIEP